MVAGEIGPVLTQGYIYAQEESHISSVYLRPVQTAEPVLHWTQMLCYFRGIPPSFLWVTGPGDGPGPDLSFSWYLHYIHYILSCTTIICAPELSPLLDYKLLVGTTSYLSLYSLWQLVQGFLNIH